MTDYLGPLTFGDSNSGGAYVIKSWSPSGGSAAVEVTVCATSADTLAVALEALAVQLYVGNTYAHHEPGTTLPVIYRVVGSALVQAGEGTWHAFEQRVSFTLALSGAPAGALFSLYTAQHVDSPASLALDGLLGSNPTLPDFTVEDDSGGGMHSVMIALAPTALSDAKWLVLASALTWTTMSNGTGSTWWGNTNRYTTSATYQTAVLDTSQYPSGKYRLWARVQQSAGIGYIMDSQNNVAVAVSRTTPHLVCIGDLDLPTADTAPNTVAPLTFSVKSDGTNTFTIGAYCVMPLSWGYAAFHPTSPTLTIGRLDVGPSGVFLDGVTDGSYMQQGIPLAPGVLAAHVGTLVSTASPTDSGWPTDWARSNDSDVTAAGGLFHVVCASASTKTATTLDTPLVVPGAWMELSLTRQVTAWTAGAVVVQIAWLDIDGNAVRTDTLSSVAATDASPVALTLHAKVPVHAARAQVVLGGIAATATVDFSAVVLRRCPLRLIVVAETANGALVNYAHPVHESVRYTPRYEIAR